jgi:hypothetical protein
MPRLLAGERKRRGGWGEGKREGSVEDEREKQHN